MRTHLLHAVPVVATEANDDTGIAANDDVAPATASSRPFSLIAIVDGAARAQSERSDDHDDYYLGGYAGI